MLRLQCKEDASYMSDVVYCVVNTRRHNLSVAVNRHFSIKEIVKKNCKAFF